VPLKTKHQVSRYATLSSLFVSGRTVDVEGSELRSIEVKITFNVSEVVLQWHVEVASQMRG
jgi:hypothetical protein